MAAFDFPSSPSNGQTYTANGVSYTYDGTVWKKSNTPVGVNTLGTSTFNNVEVTGDLVIGDYMYHSGDLNTFIGFESNDTIRFNTNGSDKLKINSSGHLILLDDNDTYMNRPSNDTLSFTTGGTERLKINSSGLTVTGGSNSNTIVSNTPAFRAMLSSDQNLPGGTNTKIAFATEELDSDNCYDTTNYRFTPNVAGYYYVSASASPHNTSSDYMTFARLRVEKNGSIIAGCVDDPGNSTEDRELTQTVSAVVQMNGSSDYLEAYAFANSDAGGQNLEVSNKRNYFQAFKLII